MIKTGLSSIVIAIFGLIEFLIVSKYYTLEDYGDYAVLNIILGFYSSILLSVTSQYSLRKEIINKVKIIQVVFFVSFVFFFFLAFSYVFVFGFEFWWEAAFCFFVPFLLIFNSFFDSSLVRKGNVGKINFSNVLAAFSSLFSITLFVAFSQLDGYFVLVFSLFVKTSVLFVLIADFKLLRSICIKGGFFSFKGFFRYLISLYRFYDGFLFSSFLGYFSSNFDRILVSYLFGSPGIALYSRALQMVNIPIVLVNRILSKNIQGRLVKGERVMNEVFFLLIFSVFCSIFLNVFFPVVIDLFLGDEWKALEGLVFVASFIIPLRFIFKFLDVYVRGRLGAREYFTFNVLYLFTFIFCYFVSFFIIGEWRIVYVFYVFEFSLLIFFVVFWVWRK